MVTSQKVMKVFQNKDTLKFENRILNVVTLPRVAEMNATRRVGACDAWHFGLSDTCEKQSTNQLKHN